MKAIYLDYAATTPVDKEVLKAMAPYFSLKFGNPSSIHSFGQEAMAAVDMAREKISRLLECQFDEIIFTGSATEANNLAIKGIAANLKKSHFITTNIEHESILEPFKELKKFGHEITYLKADKNGFINTDDLKKEIKNDTVLVSVIYANNEIGTIQPVKEIGRLLEKINKKRLESGLLKIFFHTDAVQALQFLECRPDWLKVDLMTFSGHKIYGPKGIGALYVRKNPPERLKSFSRAGTPLAPVILGGGQEFGLRSGTENVANIVGLAKAIELVFKNKEARFNHIAGLRNQLLNYIIKDNKGINAYKGINLNGLLNNRLPNNLNIRFPNVNNEIFLVALDQAGVAVSAGSACSSGALEASHVLTAIGLSEKQAKESVRITLGKNTTEKEIIKSAAIINKIVRKLKLN